MWMTNLCALYIPMFSHELSVSASFVTCLSPSSVSFHDSPLQIHVDCYSMLSNLTWRWSLDFSLKISSVSWDGLSLKPNVNNKSFWSMILLARSANVTCCLGISYIKSPAMFLDKLGSWILVDWQFCCFGPGFVPSPASIISASVNTASRSSQCSLLPVSCMLPDTQNRSKRYILRACTLHFYSFLFKTKHVSSEK